MRTLFIAAVGAIVLSVAATQANCAVAVRTDARAPQAAVASTPSTPALAMPTPTPSAAPAALTALAPLAALATPATPGAPAAPAAPTPPPGLVPPTPPTAPPSDPSYTMRTYVVGFLRKGPKWTPEKTEETAKIQEGHMANINRMAETGKLILAGPFSDGGDLRGMFVFDLTDIEEAKAMAEQDPAVQAGRLVIDWHPWYSASGIGSDATRAPTPTPAPAPQ